MSANDPQREGPWEANLSFTVRGESAEDVQRKQDAINAAATLLRQWSSPSGTERG